MAAVELVDFQDIYEAVMEELKIPTTDTTTLARVKRNINMTYLNEVAPFKRWPWLRKRTDIRHQQVFSTGTADVTQDSATVTLSAAIPVGEGSKAGFLFATDGYSEIYTISAHTAGSDTLTLSSVYTGEDNATASYKIWTNEINLPTDCRETIDIRHDFSARPMIPRGTQKIDELAAVDFRLEDRPKYYSTDDFKDPSAGDPETESDRFRIARIYPSVFKQDTTLHVTYIEDAVALDGDADEPVMPIEDRVVLVYGALKQSWIRDRNPETAADNERKFKEKLALMAGKYEDSSDMPRLEADDNYMGNRRTTRRGLTDW
jgi:hypothetical protein